MQQLCFAVADVVGDRTSQAPPGEEHQAPGGPAGRGHQHAGPHSHGGSDVLIRVARRLQASRVRLCPATTDDSQYSQAVPERHWTVVRTALCRGHGLRQHQVGFAPKRLLLISIANSTILCTKHMVTLVITHLILYLTFSQFYLRERF